MPLMLLVDHFGPRGFNNKKTIVGATGMEEKLKTLKVNLGLKKGPWNPHVKSVPLGTWVDVRTVVSAPHCINNSKT